MKKIMILWATVASVLFFAGCGNNNVAVNPSLIGKWKLTTNAVYNNLSTIPVYPTIYIFRQDKTVSIATYGSKDNANYTWTGAKDNKIALTMPDIKVTKVYGYNLPDDNTLVLVDPTGNTNYLTRIQMNDKENSTKYSFVEGLNTKLAEWNSDIVKLERKATRFNGKVKANYKKELTNLHRQRDEIVKNLAKIKRTADNSWVDFKDDVERTSDDLQKSISNIQVRFK